ncbi:MAG: hypothetical protein J0H43_12560 [Actinobacteria bacterium]|nr:hypothetical protein [Actinomycetota bacterium]
MDLEPVVYTPVSAAANLRRSAIVGAVLSAIAIILTSLEGHPLMGVFGAVGVALGAANNRMLQRSVIEYATAVQAASGNYTKRRFRGGVFMRLSGVTIVAIACALIVRPDGLGVVAGLAVFQLLMLVGASVPVFRSLRPNS